MLFKNKRGQLTLFIIIAILVVLGILLFLFWPKIKVAVTQETNPKSYMADCMQEPIQESLSAITSQGGSLEPENYFTYKGKKVEYLCYTNEYYKTCVMQRPLLNQYIQEELKESLKDVSQQCFNNLKTEMENKGYSVTTNIKGDLSVEITNRKIVFTIPSSLTLSKDGESSQNFEEFTVNYKSEYYDLIMVTLTILNWETIYGDSDIQTFMLTFPDLKVEKYKQSEGSKIYILTDRETSETFTFATRSLSWPGGYVIADTVK